MIRNILLIVLALLCAPHFTMAQKTDKSSLKVLIVAHNPTKVYKGGYSGPPAGKRQQQLALTRGQEYKNLLNKYFNQVNVVNSDEYHYTMSNEYDVTIMDDVPNAIDTVDMDLVRYGKAQKRTHPLMTPRYFPEDFDRAIISIGEITDDLTYGIRSKYMTQCHCLQGEANNIKEGHPIFKTPIKVNMPYEQIPTLKNFKKYYSGIGLTDSIKGWIVQTEDQEDKKGYWIGQIMVGMGFDDSPDCEYIAGGNSVKDITGMSLGRAANIFHWGFSASPDFMTPSAKEVFVNTIFYMAQFNGKKTLVEYRADSRLWADEFCYRKTKQLIDHKLLGKKATAIADSTQAYYASNYPYFYSTSMGLNLLVDEDAKALGIWNNDVRLLDQCVKLLESGKDTERAFRTLKRYTEFAFTSAKEWRTWLNKYRSKLFFTELGGYKFMIDTYNYPALEDELKTRAVISSVESPLENGEVLGISSKLIKLQENEYLMEVTFQLKEGFHVYAETGEGSMFINTKLNFDVPEGVRLFGKLNTPPSYKDDTMEDVKVYKNTAVFTQKMYFDPSVEMTGKSFTCKVDFQACNDYLCHPPTTKKVTISL